ncbi:MAG: LysR family transcriptional regulator, partial [Acidobacteriota bacterium]|nr:LysR family transcriptional regulator [Acidobacteriota bacterium]
DLTPALERIQTSLAKVRHLRERPAGRIRLAVARSAALMVLVPKLAQFNQAYPDIVLEVTVSNSPMDLVAGEFDAGIQIGEFIQRDMIAVRVTRDLRLAVVGSPEYFKAHRPPRTPHDLKEHACVGFRFSTGMYRWEFEKGRKQVTVNPRGPVSFDDPDLVIDALLSGIGLGVALEEVLSPLIREHRLVQVLQDWCPTFPGFYLYYPSRRHQPAALAALVRSLRLPA